MKNLFGAFLFTISLAVVSYCQTSGQLVSTGNVHRGDKPRIAVLEFTAGTDTTGVDAKGTQALQNGVVTELKKVSKVDAFAIKQSHSAAVKALYQRYLGRSVDPAGAVEIGKLLGVNYVVTGHVKVFSGGGTLAIHSELVNVETGKIVWSDDSEQSDAGLTKAGTGTLVLSSSNLIKPAVRWLTASLKAADL